MDLISVLLLLGVGVFAATYGSLVGSAGGFVILPVLIIISPESSPAFLTGVSLTGVLMAGLSSSWAYHRIGRIDYRSGLAFALPGMLGAILGVIIVHQISAYLFRIMLGIVLVITGFFLVARHTKQVYRGSGSRVTSRYIEDQEGQVYEYGFNMLLGLSASFLVGIIKSLFGIGGGLLFTPFAIGVLGFPVLVATATSVFTLVFTTIAALLSHIAVGTFADGNLLLMPAALGMVIGGQIGPRISKRVGGVFVTRLLAGTLVVIGAWMIVSQFL